MTFNTYRDESSEVQKKYEIQKLLSRKNELKREILRLRIENIQLEIKVIDDALYRKENES